MSGERPKLRLVGKEDEDLDDMFEDADDDLYAGEASAPRAKPPRLARSKSAFAIVPFDWLTDRKWDGVFAARVRLYLYLQYKSRRGAVPVRFTNAMAEEIGLARQNKMREIHWLVTQGLVTVIDADGATVRLSVTRQRLLPVSK
jgi:hypothetical protein